MYEYAPKFEKKREKGLCLLLLSVGLLLWFAAYIPGVPMGALFQLVGVGFMTAMILVYSLAVARNYVYAIEQTEDGGADFIITEYYGKRRTVVCRVSVSSVEMSAPRTKETLEAFRGERRGKHFYNYTGVLFDAERYFLRIREGEDVFFVQICANKDLISALINH